MCFWTQTTTKKCLTVPTRACGIGYRMFRRLPVQCGRGIHKRGCYRFSTAASC